jgi:hypothetical protein
MNPYRPHRQSAVPQTLHARLEIVNAIRTLFGLDDDALLPRRAGIATLRRDFQAFARDLPRTLEEAAKQVKAELCSELKKYSPNQPRVPKGEHGGGQWTSGSKAGSETAGTWPVSSSDKADGISEDRTRYASLENPMVGTRTDAMGRSRGTVDTSAEDIRL